MNRLLALFFVLLLSGWTHGLYVGGGGSPPVVGPGTFALSAIPATSTAVGSITATNTPTSCSITAGDAPGNFAVANNGNACDITVTATGHSNITANGTVYTLTIQATNASGSGSNTATVTSYLDGFVGAPTCSVQQASLLNTFHAVGQSNARAPGNGYQPPWKVAGVDYCVGYPTGQTFQHPATDTLPSGVTRAGHTFTVNGSNVTLDGWDFAEDGGWSIAGTGSNNIIKNSNFAVGANGLAPVHPTGGSNWTLQNCVLDGGNNAGITPASIVSNIQNISYNWIKNAGQDMINYGSPAVFKYNLIQDAGTSPGSHADYEQIGGTIVWDMTILFNTSYQSGVSGEGTQGWMMEPDGAGTEQGTISYNTGVSVSTGGLNYFLAVNTTTLAAGGFTVNNNWVSNLSGGFYRPGYPHSGSAVFSNNTNMSTGAAFTNP